MADIKISELTQAESLSTSDLLESAVPYNGGFLSRRMSLAQLSNYLENYVQHQALTTTAKTIVSAINEVLGDLANYYKKTETYSKTEVDTLIAGVSGLHFEVVQQLPTSDIDMNTIYLVLKQDSGQQDVYDEFICLDNTTTPATWEKIGTTEIDLSDYVTDTELTTILNDYVTSSGLSTILANYATTSAMTTALADKVDKVSGKGLSTEDYTTAEKAKLNGLTINDNTITIQQNGSTVDTFTLNQASNKTINIKAAVNNELYTEDLNDVKTVGFYCGRSGNTCTNKPSGVNQFGLYVIKLGTSNPYFKQTLIQPQTVANGGSKTYSRALYQTTWTDWVEETYTDEKVKLTEIADAYDSSVIRNIALTQGETTSDEVDELKKSSGFRVRLQTGRSASDRNSSMLMLGNNDTNHFGSIRFYNTYGGFTNLSPSTLTEDNIVSLDLPDADGTLALQSQIPDELADLSDDATHRLVTDTEKSQWNNAVLTKNLSDEDLNTLKATGFYVGASGNTCVNKPSGISQFALVVIKTASSNVNYCKQILIAPNPAGDTYYRTLTNYPVANAWSDWVKSINYSQIATIETSSTASRAYAKNELMYWNNGIYRVKTAISSGGTITASGSSANVTSTTLSAEIKAIRDALNI